MIKRDLEPQEGEPSDFETTTKFGYVTAALGFILLVLFVAWRLQQ